MNERRAEIQKQLAQRQMAEVNQLILVLKIAANKAAMSPSGIAYVSEGTAKVAVRNLEDLRDRFLTGLAQEV